MNTESKWVQFDTPGIVAIGEYKPGIPYKVEAKEADRLIAVKGFYEVEAPVTDDTDAPAL